jgi:hypothetical protein
MRNIHIILILIAALWSILPSGSPFHSAFDQTGKDVPGGIVATADPENDPSVIFMPPPR